MRKKQTRDSDGTGAQATFLTIQNRDQQLIQVTPLIDLHPHLYRPSPLNGQHSFHLTALVRANPPRRRRLSVKRKRLPLYYNHHVSRNEKVHKSL